MKLPLADVQRLGIERPTLLLDETRARSNIQRMQRRAAAGGVRFRPHFKTHQSAAIGRWFRDLGVESISVSSLDMALYFAQHGWGDITVAFPVNMLEIEKINALASRVRLHLIVDATQPVERLSQHLESAVDVWVKVDLGAHRVGVLWADFDRILGLARAIHEAPKLRFAGLLAHSGHSYEEQTPEGIRRVHSESLSRLVALQSNCRDHGVEACEISIGDTPCCSLAEDFMGADEIRPGNFVFYDLMQYRMGACDARDIAVAVACPVVSKHRARGQVALYGGAVHLGKDALSENGVQIYGRLADVNGHGWNGIAAGAAVVSVTQEHGIVAVDAERFDALAIGDVVAVLPVHSCLTTDLYREYRTLDGGTLVRRQSNDIARA